MENASLRDCVAPQCGQTSEGTEDPIPGIPQIIAPTTETRRTEELPSAVMEGEFDEPVLASCGPSGNPLEWCRWEPIAQPGAVVMRGTPICVLGQRDHAGEFRELPIVAPVNGTISSIRRFEPGHPVADGEVLLFLRPDAEPATPAPSPRLVDSRQPHSGVHRADPETDPNKTVQPEALSNSRWSTYASPKEASIAGANERPTLPGYSVLDRIGEGASGLVYRAIDEATGQPCALKCFHSREILELEWRCTEWIRARVPPQYHDQFVLLDRLLPTTRGVHAARMPLEPWPSLDRIIRDLKDRSSQPPAPRQVRSLLEGLCRAAGRLHSFGIVHRDLKPSNIFALCDPSDDHVRVKISDFTVCYAPQMDIGRLNDVDLAQAGTFDYQPPEACRRDPPIPDARTDIYSIGIIAYEFSCLRRPKLNDRTPSEDRLDPGLQWLDELYRRAASPRIEDRPADTLSLLRILEGSAVAEPPVAAPVSSAPEIRSDVLLERGRQAVRTGRAEDAELLFGARANQATRRVGANWPNSRGAINLRRLSMPASNC